MYEYGRAEFLLELPMDICGLEWYNDYGRSRTPNRKGLTTNKTI